MAKWIVFDTKRQPTAESFIVQMTVNDNSVYSKELNSSLHGVLIGIAEKMIHGDIIETPEGIYFVHNPCKELNN